MFYKKEKKRNILLYKDMMGAISSFKKNKVNSHCGEASFVEEYIAATLWEFTTATEQR